METREVDSEMVPIGKEPGANEADATIPIPGLGYRHNGLERYRARLYAEPGIIEEKIRLMNEVCVPVSVVDNICVTNFETAFAYLQAGQNQKGGEWPRVKYIISIMDLAPTTPLKFDAWSDLIPKNEDEFPIQNRLQIAMTDRKNACAIDFFPEVCKFIHNAVQTRENLDDHILVHCRKGMSRSVTMVMAYLIWSKHYTTDAALDAVLASRMVACPNLGFYQQLCMWEKLNCKLHDFDDGYSEESRLNPEYLEMRQSMGLQIFARQPDIRALEGWKRPSLL